MDVYGWVIRPRAQGEEEEKNIGKNLLSLMHGQHTKRLLAEINRDVVATFLLVYD